MPNADNSRLVRFSVTVPEDLLAEFEGSYYSENRFNRSEAVKNLMREYITDEAEEAEAEPETTCKTFRQKENRCSMTTTAN